MLQKKFGVKYGKNLMDTAKKQILLTNFAKTAGGKIGEKSAEAAGDLIGNKIADKITSLGKSKNKEKENEINEPEEILFYQKRDKKILMTLD